MTAMRRRNSTLGDGCFFLNLYSHYRLVYIWEYISGIVLLSPLGRPIEEKILIYPVLSRFKYRVGVETMGRSILNINIS